MQSVDEINLKFRWLDYRDNQKKLITLPVSEFLQRFLLHILPKRFMRIRHYGYLSNRVRIKQFVAAHTRSDNLQNNFRLNLTVCLKIKVSIIKESGRLV